MKAIDASNAAGAVDPSSMSPESESESLEDKAARNAFPSLAILPYVPATSFRPASKYGIEPILRSFSRSLFSSSRTERKTHVGASSGERGTAEGSGLPEPGVCTYTNIAGPYNASSLHFRGHVFMRPTSDLLQLCLADAIVLPDKLIRAAYSALPGTLVPAQGAAVSVVF